jgi:glycosyltransferase involved in cell wall biosynthesis
MFENLLIDLHKQINGNDVEIITVVDGGEKTIGLKRNELLCEAKGDYVSFVDDDDQVSTDYVQRILEAIESEPDVVGIEGIINFENTLYVFKHSIEFCGWYASEADKTFYRTPNHLNPIKRLIALKAGFPFHSNFGEDREYSKRIRPNLSREIYINDPIYFYGCEKTR